MLLEGERPHRRRRPGDGAHRVEGRKPVSVLWRRLDAAFADPLELQAGIADRHARPRRGDPPRRRDSSVNALGSGILETRALLAFLPRICRTLTGEELLLPQHRHLVVRPDDGEREHVLGNLDRMMIGPALVDAAAVRGRANARVLGGLVGGARQGRTASRASPAPASVFVGAGSGDAVDHAGLCRRQAGAAPGDRCASIAARTPQGWTVMPGGFARVGASPDTTAIAMQRGGQAADVWVVSATPVERDDAAARRATTASTPSSPGSPAEPRRRKPVLARPLHRARGRHGAHAARLSRAARRDLRSARNAAAADASRLPAGHSASTPRRRSRPG